MSSRREGRPSVRRAERSGPPGASVLADERHAFLAYLGRVRGLSENTVRAYRADLASFASWAERSHVDPLRATHRDLRGFLADLARAGYTVRTVDRRLSAVRDFYGWMLREGICSVDPAAALATPKGARRLPKTMSDEDVRRLLSTCDAEAPTGLRDRAFLELLYASGARISEVSRLDVPSIDFGRRQATLFGKGSKERIVPLYGIALDWVGRYLDEARPVLSAAARGGRAEGPEGALLLSTRGRRMSADALRTAFEAHVRLAGLDPGLTPHAMRHTYATELVSGGADLRSVQELLGHESLSTTQVYTHLSVERLKDAARRAHPRAR
ncbi:MAG: tyrosine recombinase XerC [Tractidigestivibacter sp.]|uniref:tyrosine recombinase XerC n=1 Tax=Tractidigestivibacter sp. TaxID=2847320 RepID=UPI002A7F9AC6|nr:tyrosine recombinase XerC [Tractidigestivibacter sp.]MDY4534287.1 tyrosine recombinase XerC [Tractidigestivibacter sp.]